MEEDRIKSAREIAMERLASVPQSTPEELEEQREREYGPRGVALANKYLEKKTREMDLQAELLGYRGKERETVNKAFLSTLLASITVEGMEKSLRAVDGIQAVTGASLEGVRREMRTVSTEFHRDQEQRRSVFEELEREKLRELGISGSAVRPRLEDSEDWHQESRRIQSEYDSRLGKLNETIRQLAGI